MNTALTHLPIEENLFSSLWFTRSYDNARLGKSDSLLYTRSDMLGLHWMLGLSRVKFADVVGESQFVVSEYTVKIENSQHAVMHLILEASAHRKA